MVRTAFRWVAILVVVNQWCKQDQILKTKPKTKTTGSKQSPCQYVELEAISMRMSVTEGNWPASTWRI